MSDISISLSKQENFYSLEGVSEDKVMDAEKSLNVEFSNDYKEYLLNYGLASIDGHEFTGLCDSERLNVVNVTKKERLQNNFIPSGFYVLECLNIDNVVIWQSSTGEIYQTVGQSAPKKICDSFEDYFASKDKAPFGNKQLVVFFSAEHGRTAAVAKVIADATGAALFEIIPEAPYTKVDLNWRNPLARCNREHIAKKDVPFVGKIDNFSDYDTVFVGFPIWYGSAPNVVNTFCKAYDWSGKKIYVFATSGGSSIGKSGEKLQPYVAGSTVLDVVLFHGIGDVEDWLNNLYHETY